jgi:hypothetical protein
MDDLPMAPGCALDERGLRLQLDRYRRTGRQARLIERTPRRLAVQPDDQADDGLIQEMIAIERECCPYFAIDFDPDQRRLAVSISSARDEPALDAVAFALGAS